jgi:hypothetical protein
MSILSTRTELGHQWLEELDPCIIVYKDNTWTGLSEEVVSRRGDRRAGGQFYETLGSVSVRNSVVGPVKIVKGDKIEVDGVIFYVGEVKYDTTTHTIELVPRNHD